MAFNNSILPSPLISIVIPVYQGEVFISETLNSLINQTYENIEIVVVDDCSTDNSCLIVNTFQTKDKRVKLERLQNNSGVHHARIHGVKKAHGDFLGFVDADDWLHPQAIEKMISALMSINGDIVICGVQFCSEDSIPGKFKVRFQKDDIIEKSILSKFSNLRFGTGSLCNKLYRRQIIEPYITNDFSEDVVINEDYLVNFGAFKTASRICLLKDMLYFYRQHNKSATASEDRAAAFAYMIRSYVICLEQYTDNDQPLKAMVDTLYSKQLSFDTYRINNVSTLDYFSDHISESLKRLANIHPTAIYSLCHIFDQEPNKKASNSQMITSLLRNTYRYYKRLLSLT
ncbi:glycosyltransferase family 2 protein [Desulfosediminicola flagellatus]|uniref:glycosyltransferase family 2 protein n=1 Tax=Desulfosediminicola flagellatus TaxID=2569541 RepID=UPI00142EF2BD|nr:glycosyltransferase family 2 protein [Desulfosediminicola flagellatus]